MCNGIRRPPLVVGDVSLLSSDRSTSSDAATSSTARTVNLYNARLVVRSQGHLDLALMPCSPRKSIVPPRVSLEYCRACRRDLVEVARQGADPRLAAKKSTPPCVGCHRVLYEEAQWSSPVTKRHITVELTRKRSRLGASESRKASHGHQNRLVYLLQSKDWYGAMALLQESPEELQTAGSQHQRCPLYWACYHDAPCNVLRAIAHACPESIWSTCDGQLQSVLDLVTARGRCDAVRALLAVSCDGDLTVALDLAYQNVALGIQRARFSRLDSVNAQDRSRQSELWDLFCVLYRTAYSKSIGAGNEQLLLHAMVALSCPEPALRLACQLYPDQLTAVDADGKTPLHIAILLRHPESPIGAAAAWRARSEGTAASLRLRRRTRGLCRPPSASSVVRILLATYPSAARHPDAVGALPLHLAVRGADSSRGASTTVELAVHAALVRAYPLAVWVPDPVNGRTPMEVADSDLSLRFVLVRAFASGLTPLGGGGSSLPPASTTTRVAAASPATATATPPPSLSPRQQLGLSRTLSLLPRLVLSGAPFH